MLSKAESTLINSLTDVDALEKLAELDLAPECIPTPKLAEIIDWASAYFMKSGRTQAPGRAELIATWGPELEAMGAELEAEDAQLPLVSWAVVHLKELYALHQSNPVITEAATAIATAPEGQRSAAILAAAHRLFALADITTSRSRGDNAADGLDKSIARYEHRKAHPETMRGLGLGIPGADAHIGWIQPGELCGLQALEKTGKSNIGLWSWWKHFENHPDNVATLFTLENTIESAFDRLACMIARIDYTKYQRAQLSAAELDCLKDWLATYRDDLAQRLFIMRPGIDGGRTAASMCQWARLRGSDSVIIDQLSHVQIQRTYRSVTEETRRAMQELVDALSEGGDPLSGLILHQASRDAKKAAEKTGSLGQHGGSNTSEWERSLAIQFGLYQSEDDKKTFEATLELLNFRRGPSGETWHLIWRPWIGDIKEVRSSVGALSGR